MQEIVLFDFHGKSVRVIRDEQVEPWWVAADIAQILEYRMASDMTRFLDNDERGTQIVRTPSGDQNMLVINESGLYSAILRSRKPEAKDFRRWITHEVLPALRKTGQYTIHQPSTYPTLSERFLGGRPWEQVVNEIEGIKSMLAITGLDHNQCVLGAFQRYDVLNDTQAMAVLPPDALKLPSPNRCAELRQSDLAQRFNVVFSTGRPDANAVNKLLERLGFQERTKGEMLDWTPTAYGWTFAIVKDLPKNAGTGRSERQLFWLESILENHHLVKDLNTLGNERQQLAMRNNKDKKDQQRSLELH